MLIRNTRLVFLLRFPLSPDALFTSVYSWSHFQVVFFIDADYLSILFLGVIWSADSKYHISFSVRYQKYLLW